MFTTLKNAFKVKEIRVKLLFTLAMLVVIRIGSQLPVPGIDSAALAKYLDPLVNAGGGAFDFFDAITGGSFTTMSIFALNINPYITSSIIIQLLTIAIPKLEELQRDGEDGRKKLTTITRYLTVGLALLQSTAMAISFASNRVIGKQWYSYAICIVALTAGSAFLMWVGEQITEHGIGNGISIVLTINIISRIPEDLKTLYDTKVAPRFDNGPATAILIILIIIAIFIGMVILVIILNDAVRNIPVQYSKNVRGRRQMGAASSSIPLKVNTSGVIPIIFAQSLLQLPIIITSFVTNGKGATGVWAEISRYMNSGNWCVFKPISELKYSVGLLVYIALVIFFAYFYTSITFNPIMVADNLKRQGGFIPGIRPGKPTSDYLNKVLNYIVFIGAVGLIIVCTLPYVFSGVFNVSVATTGTSLIIVVSVTIETIKQVESMMLVRNYKGFLEN
ncbi:MAG: preprotein translocase subunit SecY [Lachnospiraceae bacterium]|nr:preprotein translocase subunit SecY [Lachnospiraceae bacterium]